MPKETFPLGASRHRHYWRTSAWRSTDGMPLHRLKRRLECEGFKMDRGSMARWLEDAGATFDATVFAAARADA